MRQPTSCAKLVLCLFLYFLNLAKAKTFGSESIVSNPDVIDSPLGAPVAMVIGPGPSYNDFNLISKARVRHLWAPSQLQEEKSINSKLGAPYFNYYLDPRNAGIDTPSLGGVTNSLASSQCGAGEKYSPVLRRCVKQDPKLQYSLG